MRGAVSQIDPFILREILDINGAVANYNTDGKTQVAISRPPGCGVILSIGQSNASNQIFPGAFVPANAANILNFNIGNGGMYQATKPLLGANGSGSTIWLNLADQLITAGVYTKIILVPIAIGATYVADWAAGGRLNHRIAAASLRCVTSGLIPDFICWQQGENDAGGTSAADYAARLRSVVQTFRDNGVSSPFFTAISAHVPSGNPTLMNRVRQGQADAASAPLGIYIGPDTDVYTGVTYRDVSDLHFNDNGAGSVATLWMSAIRTTLGI